jgi:signal transduction histidine kinase
VNSIRRQLTRRLLGTTLGLMGLGLAALLAAAGYAGLRQFDLALRTKALAISTLTTVALDGEVHVQFTDRFLRDFDDKNPRDFFEVRGRDGAVIARSESLGSAHLPARVGTFDQPKFWFLTLPNGEPGRAMGFVYKPKPPKGIEAPELMLVVATDRDELDDTLGLLFSLAAFSAVILAAATLWVVPRVLRHGLAPLEMLGEQAALIDAGSLATRFAGDLPAELQPIADRLNALLARLELSFERERRYSADLAHELRTPLAELQSLAENALKWPQERDPATDRETLAIAREMEVLVSRMLTLARGEQGQLPAQSQSLELAGSVRAAWAPFSARASARGLRPTFLIDENILVRADPLLLRSILGNLFENAVDYAPEGGAITVVLTIQAGQAELAVSNSAGTLTEDDVARLFERFWRKESARTGLGNHTGLGLPLARTFAEAMGWTLTASLEAEGLLKLNLAGPLA